LGPLKQAEFELGDITIICGGNNTGKTYATYALFGFLSYGYSLFPIKIQEENISELRHQGTTRINLMPYISEFSRIIAQGCQNYTELLPKIFGSSEQRFEKTEFKVTLDEPLIDNIDYETRIRTATQNELFIIRKSPGETMLTVTFLLEHEKINLSTEGIENAIYNSIRELIFKKYFPKPFIASAERTGAAVFRKELTITRNLFMSRGIESDFKYDYALPVKINIDFNRKLEFIAKKTSFITEQHPDILENFADIIGGTYLVTDNDELYYVPKNAEKVKLTMDESSSAVRSLLDIGFYLRHVAQRGDLLMIDEPELNLHPENQRRMARLFARLVNLGIKVFITTHSDYIIKELNTLIMLNHDKPHLKRIAEHEGYLSEELIHAAQVKVYIAEEANIKLEGGQRKTRCQTLVAADIDPELGIEARSFDVTIDKMNQIQEDILYGEE
jgi:AAA ATPase domain